MPTESRNLSPRVTSTLTRLMTITEVADELRVSVPTVRWLRQEGRFAPAVKVGRRLVWDRDELLRWIDRQREHPIGDR